MSLAFDKPRMSKNQTLSDLTFCVLVKIVKSYNGKGQNLQKRISLMLARNTVCVQWYNVHVTHD